jgi:hypothetical protein
MSDNESNHASEMIMTQPYKNMGYTHEMELFFSEIGEECEVISSLHMMCHKKYKTRETIFNIPIITITAFIGFISGLNLNYEYMHIILGSLSLFASLLKSYFSYLKISQKGENHRISYIQYGQIYSDIQVELALEPQFRQNPSSLMNLVRVKLKNLNEVSEIIHEDIKKELEQKIKKLYYFENEFLDHDLPSANTANTTNTANTANKATIYKKQIRKPGILDIVKRIKLYEEYESEACNRYRNNNSPNSSNSKNVNIVCNDNNNANNNGNNNGNNPNNNDTNIHNKNSLSSDNKLKIELNENIIHENGLLM